MARAGPGFHSFVSIWLGQSVSLVGSRLTSFALGVWVLQETGSISLFSLITFLALFPGIVLAPFAGTLVDRRDRRWVMIWSDTAAALGSLALVLLLTRGTLALWHIFLVVTATAAASAFQVPAYMAATTLLVPRRHLGRASGMTHLGDSGAEVLAPLLGGMLLAHIGLAGVVTVDLLTFGIALGTLLAARIPQPPPSTPVPEEESWRGAAMFGWRTIRQSRPLLALLGYFAVLNLLAPAVMVLVSPLVLAFASVETLGRVLAIGSAGALAGSLLMSAWGGPKQPILGILGASPLTAAGIALAAWKPSPLPVAAGLFAVSFTLPVINGCSQVIWQTAVAPDVQGRVFSMRRMVAQVTAPCAVLAAGPLAENVFEPLMLPGGALAASAGRVLDTGPGRGIALLLALAALLLGLSTLVFWPRLRRLYDRPDS